MLNLGIYKLYSQTCRKGHLELEVTCRKGHLALEVTCHKGHLELVITCCAQTV